MSMLVHRHLQGQRVKNTHEKMRVEVKIREEKNYSIRKSESPSALIHRDAL